MSVIIRDIVPGDNERIAFIIRSVLEDFNVPKTGSTYADESLNHMYESYDVKDAHYFVVELNGELIGGAGISQLDNYKGKVCELQKMYLLPVARGKGIGSRLIQLCLEKAEELGYTECYLETLPGMEVAQKLYEKNGFEYLDNPMGDTGHCVCPVWMLKKLEEKAK
ncbi:GNAT family N-acetyltransferase [Leptobacterium flavescens]|uniref:GNAT family N-acetyltransferase n=1 Tax=Leptobacterium flavescens TaxID=472055 RepID=UPI00195472C1|nr:GNAT family N-acetyltransferase [Leptobacterium flavescens]